MLALKLLVRPALLGAVFCAIAAGPASASTIHTPEPNIAVPWNTEVKFDWAWDWDEWKSYIVFTQTPDPAGPDWFLKPGDLRRVGPFDYSNGRASMNTAGTWYWRLCSLTFTGEDDKCYYRSEIRRIDVAPPPLLTASRARRAVVDDLTIDVGAWDWQIKRCKGNGYYRKCPLDWQPTESSRWRRGSAVVRYTLSGPSVVLRKKV